MTTERRWPLSAINRPNFSLVPYRRTPVTPNYDEDRIRPHKEF